VIDSALQAGRPGEVHERRADTLATMARLSGYTVDIDVLPDGGRPDVLLVRPADQSLFVGDAKATETAGNADTTRRLSRYTTFAARYVAAGGSAVVALVVPARDRNKWLRVLCDVCAPIGSGRRIDGRVDLLDAETAVIWQWFDRGGP
jgi:hypothetical protein